jgi:hypothetical protein
MAESGQQWTAKLAIAGAESIFTNVGRGGGLPSILIGVFQQNLRATEQFGMGIRNMTSLCYMLQIWEGIINKYV